MHAVVKSSHRHQTRVRANVCGGVKEGDEGEPPPVKISGAIKRRRPGPEIPEKNSFRVASLYLRFSSADASGFALLQSERGLLEKEWGEGGGLGLGGEGTNGTGVLLNKSKGSLPRHVQLIFDDEIYPVVFDVGRN